MNILDEIIGKNLSAIKLVESIDVNDWQIWSQDGPSDETMLVSNSLNVGIIYDSLLGYSFFPLPLGNLEKCGWVCVGKL